MGPLKGGLSKRPGLSSFNEGGPKGGGGPRGGMPGMLKGVEPRGPEAPKTGMAPLTGPLGPGRPGKPPNGLIESFFCMKSLLGPSKPGRVSGGFKMLANPAAKLGLERSPGIPGILIRSSINEGRGPNGPGGPGGLNNTPPPPPAPPP